MRKGHPLPFQARRTFADALGFGRPHPRPQLSLGTWLHLNEVPEDLELAHAGPCPQERAHRNRTNSVRQEPRAAGSNKGPEAQPLPSCPIREACPARPKLNGHTAQSHRTPPLTCGGGATHAHDQGRVCPIVACGHCCAAALAPSGCFPGKSLRAPEEMQVVTNWGRPSDCRVKPLRAQKQAGYCGSESQRPDDLHPQQLCPGQVPHDPLGAGG